jgi:hypothetical protein
MRERAAEIGGTCTIDRGPSGAHEFVPASPCTRRSPLLERIRVLIADDRKTNRNHESNIFTKLHVADRAQAIVHAREARMRQQSTRH